jgi:hypothetical protein
MFSRPYRPSRLWYKYESSPRWCFHPPSLEPLSSSLLCPKQLISRAQSRGSTHPVRSRSPPPLAWPRLSTHANAELTSRHDQATTSTSLPRPTLSPVFPARRRRFRSLPSTTTTATARTGRMSRVGPVSLLISIQGCCPWVTDVGSSPSPSSPFDQEPPPAETRRSTAPTRVTPLAPFSPAEWEMVSAVSTAFSLVFLHAIAGAAAHFGRAHLLSLQQTQNAVMVVTSPMTSVLTSARQSVRNTERR